MALHQGNKKMTISIGLFYSDYF